MVIQRTWIELLGDDTTDCMLWRNFIVKRLGFGIYKTLWSFANPYQATVCINQWKAEIVESLEKKSLDSASL